MGDAMRGFLLDTSQQAEWDAKMAADERLVAAVETFLAATSDRSAARWRARSAISTSSS